MQVIYITHKKMVEEYKPSVVAIGTFDGVHLGHKKVINKALKNAKQLNILCGVMIFEPHPLEVIRSENAVDQITPIFYKLKQLEILGVDICYVINFTEDFAKISEIEFIDKILLSLNIKGIVVGYDFTFGYKGLGNTNTLQKFKENRFSVEVIEPYIVNNEKVSSTKIREYLISGNIIEANRLLGRRYSFIGKVVYGDGRGKSLGFPTVNLDLLERFINIKNGVYVVNANYNGNIYKGVMNVGYKPTFNDKKDVLIYEIHLINFTEDIYGSVLEVELIKYIREEIKFHNITELINQINNDILVAVQM